MNDTFDWNLLARYLAGECSAGQEEAARRWIESDPRRRSEVEALVCMLDVAADLPSPSALDRMWKNVASEAKLAAVGQSQTIRPLAMVSLADALPSLPESLPVWPAKPRPRRWWTRPLAAAAAVIVLAGSATAAWLEFKERTGTAAIETGMREFRTPRGQRAAMTLLDGTRVALGPDSRLRVRIPESGPRELLLDGEAVFEVTHDPARPFVVRAGMAVTEDIGTRFGVRAYDNEPVRVVVSEGAVAVRDTSGNDAAVLAPRDLAEITAAAGVAIERGIDPEKYLGWTTGRLGFHRTPLGQVLIQLERWFDIRVVVADSALLDVKVSASFEDDDLDDVLRTLAEALDTQIERRERWVYLRARE